MLQWAEAYRSEGTYTEEQIQEWLQQMQASGVPAQQAEGEFTAESAAAGVNATADGFQTVEDVRDSQQDQSLGAQADGGAALQAGTGAAWGLQGSGTLGDQGLDAGYHVDTGDGGGAQGYGDYATFAGEPTGQAMATVVQEDATSYHSETYQFNSRAQPGTTG